MNDGIQNQIRGFLMNLVEAKVGADFDADLKNQMCDDLETRFIELYNLKLLAKMPPESYSEIERELDAGNLDKIDALVQNNNIDITSIFTEAATELAKNYLEPSS